MPTLYEVYYDDQHGTRLQLLENFQELRWARRVNALGAWSIKFPADKFPRYLFHLDYRVEIWRQPEGGQRNLMLVGFCRKCDRGVTGSDRYITISGPDAIDLLRRRTIAYYAGTPYSEKSDQADDMMKAFVSENLGASATDAARNIASLVSFAVEGDLADGASMDKGASRKNLLAVLQEIASASAKLGTRVYFDVAHPLPSSFYFMTFTGQRGTDRTFPSGRNPIVLSADMGTLGNVRLVEDWANEATYCYAAGQGEAEARYVVGVSDSARMNASILNRCEVTYDGRNVEDPDALSDEGYQKLWEMRPKLAFTAGLLETPAMCFGRDVFFGDRVTARLEEESFDVELAAVGATVTAGGEALDIKLEYTS